MSRKYKIVIFGATGFTGELCARFMSERYSDIPIAIAGRSAEKLEKYSVLTAKKFGFSSFISSVIYQSSLNISGVRRVKPAIISLPLTGYIFLIFFDGNVSISVSYTHLTLPTKA